MKITGTFEIEIEEPIKIKHRVMKCICSMEEASLYDDSNAKSCGFVKNKYGLYESMGSFSKSMSELDVECTCGKIMNKWVKLLKYRSNDNEEAYGWCDIMATCHCKSPRPNYLVEKVKC